NENGPGNPNDCSYTYIVINQIVL
ncbi:hypothetical protein EVA_07401, partial [gut metagenome]